MYLKKIKILGFKSFAEKTELLFHPGITAIVGPNGCGKSNISDAFRWALGEQSAKSLRGAKMTDILFAGTATKKPLNMAEVALTFSDVGGRLPVEYEEIEITRRLLRSGESEYFINKRAARLKDIQDLFLDSGIGKSSFSIFEQGKIERIINLNPLERRCFFEDAAGIRRFLRRKQEALRHLEKTEYNLARVKDIHKEVARQIEILEKQAKRAESYQKNSVRLRQMETALFQLKWRSLKEKIENSASLEKERAKRLEESERSLNILEGERKSALRSLDAFRQEAMAAREEVLRIKSDRDLKTREREEKERRIGELSSRKVRLKREAAELVGTRFARRKERIELILKMRAVEREIFALSSLLREGKTRVMAIEEEILALRQGSRQIQEKRLSILKKQSEIEGELKTEGLSREHNEAKIEELLRKLREYEERTGDITDKIASLEGEIADFNTAFSGRNDALAVMKTRSEELSERIAVMREKMDALYRDRAGIKARQEALLRLRDDMEGFSAGARRLVLESANRESPIFGKLQVLYASVSAKEGEELALSCVMRPYVQTLTVANRDDFYAVLNFAKEHKIVNFSLLCLENISFCPRERSGKLTAFSGFIADNPVSRFFFRDTFVCGSVEEGVKAVTESGESLNIWTRDGFFIDHNGVAFHISEGEKNVFLREAELKSLEERLSDLESTRLRYADKLTKLVEEKRSVNARKEDLERELKREEIELLQKRYNLKKLREDLEDIGKHIVKWREEIAELAQKMEQQDIELRGLRDACALCLDELRKVEVGAEEIAGHLEERLGGLDKESSALSEQKSLRDSKLEEFRRYVQMTRMIDIRDEESIKRERGLEEETRVMEADGNRLVEELKTLEKEAEEIKSRLERRAKTGCDFEETMIIGEKRIADIEKRLESARETRKEKESLYREAGRESAALSSVLSALEAEFAERDGVSVAEALSEEVDVSPSLEKLESEIRSLRKMVADVSDINMTSIGEFDKYRERELFLSGQIEDLELARKDLIEIISHLDGESRKIFRDTFQNIRENFQNNFQILFRGGEADLRLTESADILEAGIEIVARPPGKKLRTINLLSGGEKCLAAMALLFAIFEIRPAPFCILDEIDAPLDDANVDRFLNVVRKFTDRCQFIIITHNKRTMNIADALIGVSMREKGVTSLLSLEFVAEKGPRVALVQA